MHTTVYRYERPEALPRIRKEGGLMPTEHNMQLLIGSILDKRTAVYGLLEPIPTSWTENRRYPGAWERLKLQLTPSASPFRRSGGNLLLQMRVNTRIDNVGVIDQAPMEDLEAYYQEHRDQFSHAQAFGTQQQEWELEQKLHDYRNTCYRRRSNSLVPLTRYVDDHVVRESIALPEVVIFSRIVSEQISVASDQPLLIDALERARIRGYTSTQETVSCLMKMNA
jgi:hypothetical protein